MNNTNTNKHRVEWLKLAKQCDPRYLQNPPICAQMYRAREAQYRSSIEPGNSLNEWLEAAANSDAKMAALFEAMSL